MAELDIAVAAAADDDSEEDEEILLVKASPQFATMGTCRGDPKGGVLALFMCLCVPRRSVCANADKRARYRSGPFSLSALASARPLWRVDGG